MKSILLSFIMIFSGAAVAADFYIMGDDNSHLYLANASQIEEVDTITYVIDAKEPDVLIANAFYAFSEEIGLKNGAVMLTPNDPDAFKYISKSGCPDDLLYNGATTVVFENKILGECTRFIIVDTFDFANALGQLHRYIKEHKNINKAKLKNDLKTVINDIFKGFDANVPISVQEFANRIVDSLSI